LSGNGIQESVLYKSNPNGYQTGTIDGETIYTLSCENETDELIQTATVRVVPTWEEF
jgi:hypothetical protein